MSPDFTKPTPLSRAFVMSVPESSGVYSLLDDRGAVLFIGVAASGRLRQRIHSHLDRRDIPEAAAFCFKPVAAESDAEREQEDLILQYMPRYNSQAR